MGGKLQVLLGPGLVNIKSLQLECKRVLNKVLPMPVLSYSHETMIWDEKEV